MLFILGVYFHWLLWNSLYWQSAVSSRLTLKKRGKHARFPLFLLHVYFHWSLFFFCMRKKKTKKKLIPFETRCIGMVLLVLGSHLKNEVYIHVSQCLSSFSLIAFEIGYTVFEIGRTVSSQLTLKERGKRARFPLFLIHDYFHWWLLKLGVLAWYC